MENLQIGLNIIFPIFFVIFVGYFLKTKKILDENFISKSTTLVFYVALPAKLFFDIKNSKVNSLDIKYVLYLLLGTLLIFGLSWISGYFFIKDKKKLSAFVHCSYRSNFVYIGIPILDLIFSEPAMDSILIVIIFGLTLYNMLAIILLTYYGDKKLSITDFFIKVIKNPMIIAIVLGLCVKFLNIPIYSGVESGASIIAKLCTPLSLILIGGSLNFNGTFSDVMIICVDTLIKDVIGAAILVPVGFLIGFTNSQLVVAYIFFGTPCALNCFIMGKQMGSDANLTSQIITASFVFSIVSYAVGIALLKYYSII
ncbi:AEC family transporter [Peptoniphilus mikwangii]|uniref:AEC family transporter n=1 Tax=Peptoniphilus mikwangii TaxID=1354300 RepID=UPI00040CA595|nr:AEC family transporter [Peptoniphilus mikwangii]